HPERPGHLRAGLALHRRLPKRLPGRTAEGTPRLLGRPGEDAPLVLLVPPGALILLAGRQLLEALLGGRVAGGPAGPLVRRQEVAQLVARHREQPAAEGAAAAGV